MGSLTMTKSNPAPICLAALAASLLVAACASEPPKPAVRENLVQKTATVESIDQASRVVTLRGEEGNVFTVQVGEEVKNLPQVRAGDKVTVTYYEALAAEVKKPGEGVAGVQADTAAVTAPPGGMPAAGAGMLLRTTVVIESVDKKQNTVTFTRSDGASRTVAVESPEGREFIKGLKKGDNVEVAYTEAVAIEVKPVN
jgi:FtsP/CotA-like multicopper oxidase with cupredoxin domain